MNGVRYKVVLKRHRPSVRPDVCVFYDEDRKKTLKEMQKYVKAHGFTTDDKDGRGKRSSILLPGYSPKRILIKSPLGTLSTVQTLAGQPSIPILKPRIFF